MQNDFAREYEKSVDLLINTWPQLSVKLIAIAQRRKEKRIRELLKQYENIIQIGLYHFNCKHYKNLIINFTYLLY